jgi:hypothetical protein
MEERTYPVSVCARCGTPVEHVDLGPRDRFWRHAAIADPTTVPHQATPAGPHTTP